MPTPPLTVLRALLASLSLPIQPPNLQSITPSLLLLVLESLLGRRLPLSPSQRNPRPEDEGELAKCVLGVLATELSMDLSIVEPEHVVAGREGEVGVVVMALAVMARRRGVVLDLGDASEEESEGEGGYASTSRHAVASAGGYGYKYSTPDKRLYARSNGYSHAKRTPRSPQSARSAYSAYPTHSTRSANSSHSLIDEPADPVALPALQPRLLDMYITPPRKTHYRPGVDLSDVEASLPSAPASRHREALSDRRPHAVHDPDRNGHGGADRTSTSRHRHRDRQRESEFALVYLDSLHSDPQSQAHSYSYSRGRSHSRSRSRSGSGSHAHSPSHSPSLPQNPHAHPHEYEYKHDQHDRRHDHEYEPEHEYHHTYQHSQPGLHTLASDTSVVSSLRSPSPVKSAYVHPLFALQSKSRSQSQTRSRAGSGHSYSRSGNGSGHRDDGYAAADRRSRAHGDVDDGHGYGHERGRERGSDADEHAYDGYDGENGLGHHRHDLEHAREQHELEYGRDHSEYAYEQWYEDPTDASLASYARDALALDTETQHPSRQYTAHLAHDRHPAPSGYNGYGHAGSARTRTASGSHSSRSSGRSRTVLQTLIDEFGLVPG